MNRYFGLKDFPIFKIKPVATIGVFDGVHLGHQQILKRMVACARELKTESIVITFDSHPKSVIDKNSPRMITSLAHRLVMFETLGIDNVLILTFHDEFAKLSADNFLKDILIDKINMQLIILGEFACFGRDRQGNVDFLQDRSVDFDFKAERIAELKIDNKIISSTAIRHAVSSGDLIQAKAMLGHPVVAMGTVASGNGVGRTFGYPTLNLDLHHELHPPKGVYITQTIIGDTRWNSVTNIGNRPTVDATNTGDVIIESHILHDNIGNLYGQVAEVEFLKKIRNEQKFANKELLVSAIDNDALIARKYFEEV